MTPPLFADELRTAMHPATGRQWTAADLSAATGLAIDTIRAYLAGTRKQPGPDALVRLRRALPTLAPPPAAAPEGGAL